MTQAHEPQIADFVDLKLLQRLQDTFAEAMGVAAVTVDRQGKPITAVSNFCKVCLMIRSTDKGLARCQRCDAEGGQIAHKRQEPFAYKCAGGFLDAAAPIIIDGQYLGCILCGQVIPSDAQEEFIQDIIARNIPLGLPPDELEAEIRKITPLPRDRFQAAVEMLSLTANHIIEKGAANLAHVHLLREAQERAALQAALQEAQLRALKAQINPHFLFNSLTLLSYTALEENATRTEEIAYNLSDLLRYSLRNISTSVELGEEIEMIKQYLAIQQIGFGARLQSEVIVDPELQRVEIPCMLLQPLVENAVLHGAEPLKRPVTITIKAYRQNAHLVLEVADDGAGMPAELVQAVKEGNFEQRRRSIGLRNVYQRLLGEYGEQGVMDVESAPDRGTVFRLLIGLTAAKQPQHTASELPPLSAKAGDSIKLPMLPRVPTPLRRPVGKNDARYNDIPNTILTPIQ